MVKTNKESGQRGSLVAHFRWRRDADAMAPSAADRRRPERDRQGLEKESEAYTAFVDGLAPDP
jgi:hypothetical protein